MSNTWPVVVAPGGQATPVILVASGHAAIVEVVSSQGTPVAFVSSGPALLVASSTTNLVTQQDLQSSYWDKQNVTTPSSNRVMETAVNAGHGIVITSASRFARAAGTQNYSASMDVKPVGTKQWISLGLFSGDISAGAYQFYDVINGVTSSQSSYGGFGYVSSSISALGGGTYRCQISILTGGISTGLTPYIQLIGPTGPAEFNYLGVVTNGFDISNIQVTQP